jgi:uncharacterized Zn-finger protein
MAPDTFWRWQLTIGGAGSAPELDAVMADVDRLPAGPEQRDLLALCALQRAVVDRPAPPAADDNTPGRDWTTTEFRVLLDGRSESNETLAGELTRSPTAVHVLRRAIHQFHLCADNRPDMALLHPRLRAYLETQPSGARSCPWCHATF